MDRSYIDLLRIDCTEMAIDPVCGMEVDKRETSLKSIIGGREIYFCCSNCKSQFDANPSQFLFDYS